MHQGILQTALTGQLSLELKYRRALPAPDDGDSAELMYLEHRPVPTMGTHIDSGFVRLLHAI